ncbi:amino acid ABC transporter permease [Chrysiogenes arsenatis]|uniref:amino acid ABC transporter permease n=1 Tax=Chrysiogenes arsenatis TaxID=309797 RepID=UPI000A035035|nr:amino acid ABC transporter permease [Chrysiogenes arsenatis]
MVLYEYRQKFWHGWRVTLLMSFASLLASMCLGFLLAAAQRSPLIIMRQCGRMIVEIIRGTPLLVQILIFFYVVADAFGLQNRYIAGVFILALFSGAYISEIIRAGIESIGQSQIESARSLGFTTYQMYRYIIMPQVLRRILPPLTGQFASLIKDSSLLSVIAISEFTLNAQEVNAFTFSTLESYLPLALGYLALTLPISLWSRQLEKRFAYAT